MWRLRLLMTKTLQLNIPGTVLLTFTVKSKEFVLVWILECHQDLSLLVYLISERNIQILEAVLNVHKVRVELKSTDICTFSESARLNEDLIL